MRDVEWSRWLGDVDARTVARWAKTEREEFYLLVKQKRGDAAMRQLVEDIRAVWGSV